MTLIFGTGAESEFAFNIPNIQQEIRQHVEEEQRQDTLLLLVREYESAIKKYEEEKERQFKNLNEVGWDRARGRSEYLAAYEEYYQSRVKLISSLIDYRFMMLENVNNQELLLIVEDALNRPQRTVRKEERQAGKSQDRLIGVFVNLNEILSRNIQDSLKAEVIRQSLHTLETSIYAAVDETYKLTVERRNKLDDRHATREEIMDMYARSNQLRLEAARNFAVLRQDVIENTNQQEWQAINRELEAFLKN
jgi:hypothetical protein